MPSEYDNVVYYECEVTIEALHLLPWEMADAMIVLAKDIAERLGFKFVPQAFGPCKLMMDISEDFQSVRVKRDALLDELRAAGFKPRSARIAAIVSMEVF